MPSQQKCRGFTCDRKISPKNALFMSKHGSGGAIADNAEKGEGTSIKIFVCCMNNIFSRRETEKERERADKHCDIGGK